MVYSVTLPQNSLGSSSFCKGPRTSNVWKSKDPKEQYKKYIIWSFLISNHFISFLVLNGELKLSVNYYGTYYGINCDLKINDGQLHTLTIMKMSNKLSMQIDEHDEIHQVKNTANWNFISTPKCQSSALFWLHILAPSYKTV